MKKTETFQSLNNCNLQLSTLLQDMLVAVQCMAAVKGLKNIWSTSATLQTDTIVSSLRRVVDGRFSTWYDLCDSNWWTVHASVPAKKLQLSRTFIPNDKAEQWHMHGTTNMFQTSKMSIIKCALLHYGLQRCLNSSSRKNSECKILFQSTLMISSTTVLIAVVAPASGFLFPSVPLLLVFSPCSPIFI